MSKSVTVVLGVLLAAGCSSGSTQTKSNAPPAAQKTAPAGQADGAGSAEAAQGSQKMQTSKTAGETSKEGAGRIQAAATGDHRSQENIDRNEYRHPVETLEFFGLEPDMTVVEIWPSSGWYTEVLAPSLTDGTLVAANFAPKPEKPDYYRNDILKKFNARMRSEKVFSNVRLGMLQPGERIDIGEPGSADMVVTFRNFHNFTNADIADQMLDAWYKVLEPGGILGVVDHRAKAGVDPKKSAETGYLPVSYVVDKAEAAGFELVAKSEINANPKDTTDHPKGVWTLPPTYRLGDKNHDKYEAIGESDRMTLKFRKPANETNGDSAE